MKFAIKIIITLFLLGTILNNNLMKRKRTQDGGPLSTLNQGQRLDSTNKKYFATMQTDGNFVLYSAGSFNGKGKDNPIWATNTMGKGTAPYKVWMQDDGNLVLYDSKSPIWASNTGGKGKGPYKLLLQDDGNFVLYDSTNAPIWASNTMGKQ
jgi:hypothetical protein